MHELVDRTFDSLAVGMHAGFSVRIGKDDLDRFGDLALDMAPGHHDVAVARQMGYRDPIAYGFLVFSRFSGLLGMVLPGPRTVIHSASYTMAMPVFLGDELTYRVEITRLVNPVRAVMLKLTVCRSDEIVLRGDAQCGFRR